MKRYITGIIAIIIATGLAAFTKSPEKARPNSYAFYFTGDPLTPGDVADESQWSLTAPTGTECAGTQKACMIVVDDNQTQVVNQQRVLKSSLNITAVAGTGGSGSGYVPQMPHTGISDSENRP